MEKLLLDYWRYLLVIAVLAVLLPSCLREFPGSGLNPESGGPALDSTNTLPMIPNPPVLPEEPPVPPREEIKKIRGVIAGALVNKPPDWQKFDLANGQKLFVVRNEDVDYTLMISGDAVQIGRYLDGYGIVMLGDVASGSLHAYAENSDLGFSLSNPSEKPSATGHLQAEYYELIYAIERFLFSN